MVKDCVDHKTNLTTGGHNIMIDIIPNDIATACLKIGKTVLDDETFWFAHGGTGVWKCAPRPSAMGTFGAASCLVSETFRACGPKLVKFAR